MLPTPARQITRELFICTVLSTLVILVLVHFVHLLYASAFPSTPLGKLLAAPAAQIAQIAQMHAYVFVVFKVTMACTVLVLALREVVACVGISMGWWGASVPEEADLEAGKLADDDDWSAEEKASYSDAPYPNETVLL
ncbi:hypothetical protein C8R46DRAFT_1235297 [Mycena filopes]|nr:hypothetical protein C8R46DRAFT_1235297 [Mycena filopes]